MTIYNGEQGRTRSRQEQLAALVALRGIGKREAQAKLELLKNGAGKVPAKAGAAAWMIHLSFLWHHGAIAGRE